MEHVNVYAEPMYGREEESDECEENNDSSDEETVEIYRDPQNLEISELGATMNYLQSGSKVLEDPDSVKWEDHKELYSDEIAILIEDIHASHGSPFKLKECQEIALHALAQMKNVFLVVGTGVGKTVTYVYGIDILRKVTGVVNGVGLIEAPLSAINTQKMADNPDDVIILTLSGRLSSANGTRDAELSGGREEDIYNGKYKLIISHPEAWATELGQRILETLKRRGLVILLAIDEFHKMLLKHWGSFRPGMADTIRRLRAFLLKGCPTVCLSATATIDEINATSEILSFREPALILSSSPVQSQFKLVVVKSPSANTPSEGYTNSRGLFKPGFLNLFIRIYGKEFVDEVKQGRSQQLRRCFMFFRTDSQLITVYNYLREHLGDQDLRTAPFVMFTSSTIGQSALVITARAPEVPLILTTQKLEMGWHMPGNDIIIFARPPDTLHSIIQGMGRAGRPHSDMPGYRRKALVYLLWNNYDLNSSKDMDDVVKEICREKTKCLKTIIADYFVGEGETTKRQPLWCCSNCNRSW